jgi:hypothetical protein
MPEAKRHPTRRELLDALVGVEIALSSLTRRWQDSIPAELRAEIMTDAYEPVLSLLIQAGRLPLPRPPS